MISFHSLEDRIVKTFIARESRDEVDRRAPVRAAAGDAAARAGPHPRRRGRGGAPTRARARPMMRVAERTVAVEAGAHDPAEPAAAAGGDRQRLLLVKTAYEARRLFTAIDRADSSSRRLDGEYKRLEAERQAQATNLRVEQRAREKLRMRTATPAVTHYVGDPAAAPPRGASAP